MAPTTASKIIIGWNERVALPEWGIKRLRAKVDTGARSSALHVINIVPVGTHRVGFEIVLSTKSPRRRRVVAPISRIGRVRSSSGHGGTRFFVKTLVRLGPVEREVEMNLVDREKMIFRMLLGRSALTGLLVDVTRAKLLDESRRGR